MFCLGVSLVLFGFSNLPWTGAAAQIVVLVEKNATLGVNITRDWSDVIPHFNSSDIVTYEIKERIQAKDLTALCDKYRGRKLAIIDTLKDCTFADIASTLFSPYIRVSAERCQGQDVLNVRPGLAFYGTAAVNYTNTKKTLTARAVFFYDEKLGRNGFPSGLLKDLPRVLTRPLSPSDNRLESWLGQLFESKTVHFVLAIGSQKKINHLIQTACEIGIPDSFRWTVVLTDAQIFNWSACPINHLLVFRHRLAWNNVPRSSYSKSVDSAFLLDALSSAVSILAGSTANVACADGTISTAAETANHIPSQLNGVTQDNLRLMSSEYPRMVLDVLKVNYTGRKTNRVGEWTMDTGIVMYNSSVPSDNRIVVVTKHEPPFVIRENTEDGPRYTGYAIDVFDEVARRLEIDYTMYEPADGQYGNQRADGTWDGLMGEITTGYADIAVASLSMTTERDEVADFSTPYYEFGGIQILIKSKETSSSLLAFTTVFTKEVWACWASVLVLTGVALCFCEHFSPYSPYKSKNREHKKFTLKESLWLVIASLTMSGPEKTPKTFSSRMMVGGFWFFSSIMMATYTANLAAFLTTSRLNMPIESLDDLAKQSAIKYSVVKGTPIHDYFERMAKIESNLYLEWKNMSFSRDLRPSDDSGANYAVWDYPLGDKYMTIWSAIQKTGLINDSTEGVNRVLQGNFAFIHESPMVQYELSKHCDLLAVGKMFSSRPYAFALAQGSPLTNLISFTILELQSETILETLKTKWWKNGSLECSRIDESGGLTFHTVGGIFLLILAGICLGLMCLAIEKVCASFTGIPKEQHNVNLTNPNSRTNLASDFDAGFSYLAKEYRDPDYDIDGVTLEMARMY